MASLQVFIFSHDTLQALGLKHILQKFFGISATTATGAKKAENSDCPSAVYITTAECFIEDQEFFIPRRGRTVILSPNINRSPGQASIATDQSESEIIEELKRILTANAPAADTVSTELTQREIEVLRLVAMGYINKEIASALSISFNTVLSHRKNITAKLGIRSVSGLGVYAMMNGYISESDLKR